MPKRSRKDLKCRQHNLEYLGDGRYYCRDCKYAFSLNKNDLDPKRPPDHPYCAKKDLEVVKKHHYVCKVCGRRWSVKHLPVAPGQPETAQVFCDPPGPSYGKSRV